MTSTRDTVVETTSSLLEAQGYHATGLNQIIRESSAPKGSLYHYFPDGKEELVAEAMQRAGESVERRIDAALAEHADAADAVHHLVSRIADHVERTHFQGGGPLTMVALETATSSERINLACRTAYTRLQSAFERKLQQAGYPDDRTQTLAEFITSTIEGATLLARTFHTGDPLRRVATELRAVLDMQPPPTDPGHGRGAAERSTP